MCLCSGTMMCQHQGLVGCTRLKTYDQRERVQCIVSQLSNTHNAHVQIMTLRTLRGQKNGSLANMFTEFTIFVLDTTKYCTHQPTITWNEVMDMLKI
jgi:hypothetical protein